MAAEREYGCAREGGALVLRVSGDWRLGDGLPAHDTLRSEMERERPDRLVLRAEQLGAWDSSLVAFLCGAAAVADADGVPVDLDALPEGLRRLLALARAVPEKKDARSAGADRTWLERLGEACLRLAAEGRRGLAFTGEAALGFGRLVRGRARFRSVDLNLLIEDAGARALPIVTLISFLVGLILAFVGAIQLSQFGAEIYVANLVGIAMLREMGAMMAAIIMAGRTGAAYAAQLGTMKVTQEIDALTTMGIPAIDFLVLPRMIALGLMMPLLALYADLVGIVGGAVVGTMMLDLSPSLYFAQTVQAVSMADFTSGLIKAFVFGLLVAISGCLRGMECGNSSSAVGDAATSAVVTSIVLIIVSDAVFTVLFNLTGF